MPPQILDFEVIGEVCVLFPSKAVLQGNEATALLPEKRHVIAKRDGARRVGPEIRIALPGNADAVPPVGDIPPPYPQASRKNGADQSVRALFLDCAPKSGPA